ncbi:thioesterase family protein [Pacificispira spongiicola]|uniref:thioesterase family protein n=1 Tax=Pacificispira spongiicola TaxID=2729598 RepID=UPI001D0C0BBA|nr:thioesterase family protein [Pacificispira spongiicola]
MSLPLSLACPIEWTDYNGHMNVAYYARAFDIASAAFLSSTESPAAPLTLLRSRIDYRREVLEGAELRFDIRILPSAPDSGPHLAIFMMARPENGAESYLAAVEQREFRRP